MDYYISKSKYTKAVQCSKMLWMDENKKELAQSTASDSVLETGTEVGKLARAYFGEYEEVAFDPDKAKMVSNTRLLLDKACETIAEASFIYGDCFCSVDILRNENGKFSIVEVKSSTEIHDIYYDDMAFQYYVLTHAGYDVGRVCNMHINNEYVRCGELELNKLFALEDCTEEVLRRQDHIENRLEEIRHTIGMSDEPLREIDLYCDKPYECAYKGYCHSGVPTPSVFDIHRLKASTKYDLYHQGIISFSDIMEQKPKLSDKQYAQVEAVYEDAPPVIKIDGIKAFLDTLEYPLYHLDFETFQQAIPQFDGVKPYMQIPFQYSLHIQREKNASEEHYEFLAKEGVDPRRELAESLCRDIPMGVCSLAYNMSFEKTVIKNLAEAYDDLSEHLMDIHDHMHDLMVPFQKQFYYRKEFMGSYSIKYVLPALCPGDPELDYHSLEGVHNGSEAMATYAELTKHTPEEIEVIRKQLLAYCRLDTLAMVKILEKLYQIVEG